MRPPHIPGETIAQYAERNGLGSAKAYADRWKHKGITEAVVTTWLINRAIPYVAVNKNRSLIYLNMEPPAHLLREFYERKQRKERRTAKQQTAVDCLRRENA